MIELWLIAVFVLGILFEYFSDAVSYLVDWVQANTTCRWYGHEWFNDIAEDAHSYPDLCVRCGCREYRNCEDVDCNHNHRGESG